MAQAHASWETGTDSLELERGRRPLFVTLAQHALARGEHVPAAIRLLEGVRRRPESFLPDAHRDAILAVLAHALRGPGLEQEILAAEHAAPGFVDELFAALETVGASHVATSLDRAMALLGRKRDSTSLASSTSAAASSTHAVVDLTAEPEPLSAIASALLREPLESDASRADLAAASSADLPVVADPSERPSYAPSSRRFSRITPVPVEELLDTGDSLDSRWTARREPYVRTQEDEGEAAAGDEAPTPDLRSRLRDSQPADPRQIPVALSQAWLRERLGADDASLYTPPPLVEPGQRVDLKPRRTHTDSDHDDEEYGLGLDRSVRDRLSLHRMSTAEELLSYAAAEVDDEPRRRRSRTHGAMLARVRRPRPARRRLISFGLLIVALLCAAAALMPIAWETLSESWHGAALDVAQTAAARGTRGGLLEARATLAEELAERPELTRTAGFAVLVDRLLVHRFGEESTIAIDGVAIDGEPLARLGVVIERLGQGDVEAAHAAIVQTPEHVWASEPGTQAWAQGLVAAARGEIEVASASLALAVDQHRFSRLALLDLAELALATGHRDASSAFVERAQAGLTHPFVALALRLLTSDPLAFGDDALLPTAARVESLSRTQQGWYWLARGYQALRTGSLGEASDAVTRGRAASPGNGQLLFLEGVVALREGRVTEAAAALTTGAQVLSETPRGRRYRSHVAELLGESGRPDLVLQLLEYRSHEPVESLRGRLTPSDVALLSDALQGLGRADEALAVLGEVSAGDAVSVSLRRCGLLRALGREADVGAVAAALRGAESRAACALHDVISNGRFEEALAAATSLMVGQPSELGPALLRAELASLSGAGAEAALLIEERTARQLVRTRASILAALYRARAGVLEDGAASAIVALEVTDMGLLVAQAEIALLSGLSQRAAQLLGRVEAMRPSDARVAALRGLHVEHGHHEHRLTLLRAGRQGHLSVPGLYLELGRVHAKRGEAEAALEALTMAMQRGSEEAAAVKVAASAYDTQELRAAGRRKLTGLLDALPSTRETRTLRGRLAYEIAMLYRPSSGNYEAARFLKEARVLLGEQPEIHYQLGEYFTANNMPGVALKHYEQANAIDPSFPIPST